MKTFDPPIQLRRKSGRGDARLITDNRAPLTDQAIEQRRLADIGPSDDCDQGVTRAFWLIEFMLVVDSC